MYLYHKRTWGKRWQFYGGYIWCRIIYKHMGSRSGDLQDGGLGKHSLPPSTTTSKLQLNCRKTSLRNGSNQLEWRSCTTQLKKKPHPSRLVGEAETWRCGWNGLVPHPRVVEKNQEGYFRSEESYPLTRLPSPGFQCWGKKSLWILAVKTSGDWVNGRKLLDSQAVHLKGPAQTYSDSLPLSSSTGAAWRHQWHTRRNWSVWHQGESWGMAFSKTELLAEAIAPLLRPLLTEPPSAAGTIVETPSTWLTLFVPPCRFLGNLPHPSYGSTQLVNSGFSIQMTYLGSCI